MLTIFAAPCPAKGLTLLPTWYKYLEGKVEDGRCVPQINQLADFGLILLAVVDILLRIGALVAVGYVIWGGFQYIMSQGESDRVKSGRETIINALTGLVIAMVATGVVALIGGKLGA